MKFTRRLTIYVMLLAILILVKLNTFGEDYSSVETFRGAQLEEDVFYPLIARSVNDANLLQIVLNDETYRFSNRDAYVNDQLQVMVSPAFVRDFFSCSARVYEGNRLFLERGDATLTFFAGQNTALYNEDMVELVGIPTVYNDTFYVPLRDVCKILEYKYRWSSKNYRVQIIADEETMTVQLPRNYDLRKKNRTASIRNQGSQTTCWAFASIEAMESSLMPEQKAQFDENHMIANKPYAYSGQNGGDYTMALAYLLSWKGPVSTEDGEIHAHVQQARFYGQDDIDDIKWAVYQYGGVSTSIYANVAGASLKDSSYYNEHTNSYCYMGSESPNHDVVIIGWDDAYRSTNFANDVPGDGAFICQNSWGTSFGDEGVFYVSYYDTNVGDQGVSYVNLETADNYADIYQSDLCGWNGQIGYNKEDVTAANVYTARADAQVAAAGFYALDKDTTYEIYFVSKYDGVNSFAKRVKVASGTAKYAGYYTVEFDEAKRITKGEEFAVIIHINTPGADHPMAMEYQSARMEAGYVDIKDGLGYISRNGLDWENVEEKASGNLCLKAYTKISE
ncbi:MAG: cell surface protein [Lachnospiraceae bacterium]|nr:cell surface protein [Lachnospiraceae bacterium]